MQKSSFWPSLQYSATSFSKLLLETAFWPDLPMQTPCVRMKLLLIHQKLWKVVEYPTATAEHSQGALALTGLNVKNHHLGKVAAAKTAKELWDDLETA
jgi:hypothetical protein